MSELANKAEITKFSERGTTRAWVPGRGIMGRKGYIRPGITRGCNLGFRTNRVLFVSFNFFLCLVLSFSGTMHPFW